MTDGTGWELDVLKVEEDVEGGAVVVLQSEDAGGAEKEGRKDEQEGERREDAASARLRDVLVG